MFMRRAHQMACPRGSTHQLGIAVWMGLCQIKHQAIGVRFAEREADISFASRVPRGARIVPRLFGRGLERVCESIKRGSPDRRQDCLLIAKVAIGSHGTATERVRELAHADAIDTPVSKALLRDGAEPLAERVYLGARQIFWHADQASGGCARGNSRTYLKKRARCRSDATSTRGRKRIVSSTGASSASSRCTNPRRLSSLSAPAARLPPVSRTPKQ